MKKSNGTQITTDSPFYRSDYKQILRNEKHGRDGLLCLLFGGGFIHFSLLNTDIYMMLSIYVELIRHSDMDAAS